MAKYSLQVNGRKIGNFLRGALLGGAIGLGAVSAQAGTPGPVVTLTDGRIQGIPGTDVDRFLGIPFAAPPVGALRWRPPQPPAAWTGLREATYFGHDCAQTVIYGGFNAPSTTEDCLYLNVFAPHHAGESAEKLPVMVWIYGGGFYGGDSDDYDGRALAKQGKVVVVSINYRVGVFGHFAHPALTAEKHPVTNYGLMDQQYALRWVRRNIAAFGGDPRNVTIFGESAGGVSVYAQLASPLAKGLFQRAIVESGSFAPLLRNMSEADAEKIGETFAASLGCKDQTAACLRALPVKTILDAQADQPTQPVIDGTVITQSFDQAFSTGQFNRVPVIHGTNQNEFRWIVGLGADLAGKPVTAADYHTAIAGAYGKSAPLVEAEYPLAQYASPGLALSALQTDAIVACPSPVVASWLAQYVPVYEYEFQDPNPPIYLRKISYPWGASHTTEVAFVFPGYHGHGLTGTPTAAEQALSQKMIADWTHFAWTGQPTADAASWPRFTPGGNEVKPLLPNTATAVSDFNREHHCDFWAKLLGWPQSL